MNRDESRHANRSAGELLRRCTFVIQGGCGCRAHRYAGQPVASAARSATPAPAQRRWPLRPVCACRARCVRPTHARQSKRAWPGGSASACGPPGREWLAPRSGNRATHRRRRGPGDHRGSQLVGRDARPDAARDEPPSAQIAPMLARRDRALRPRTGCSRAMADHAVRTPRAPALSSRRTW
jgi:hypothetical protein